MIRKEEKQEVILQNATHEGDTGSPEVQVAILTKRTPTSPSTSRPTRRIIIPAAASLR